MRAVQSPSFRLSGRGTPAGPGRPHSGEPFDRAILSTPVLIVEDEAMIAWALESYFEDMGFTDIAIAANGPEAIAFAASRSPGLVVSDINLGTGMDGVAATAAIAAQRSIPVLFVTGYAGAETRSRIDRDLPGAVILSKPVDAAALRGAVAMALNSPNSSRH